MASYHIALGKQLTIEGPARAWIVAEPRGITESDAAGGTPAWVPANAVIHIDLVGGSPQGRAWVEGTGVVAVDTLLGSDPNAMEGWGPTSYDPEDLTERGLVCAGTALIGAALVSVLAGATVRIQIYMGSDICAFALMSADGEDGLEADLQADGALRISSFNGSLFVELAGTDWLVDTVTAMACTVATGRLEVAGNGSDALVGVVDETDRPPGNPLVAAIVDVMPHNNPGALQSITLYDPLPSTAGLSELSEVAGVTRLAPPPSTSRVKPKSRPAVPKGR
jgi:hypothetical protein